MSIRPALAAPARGRGPAAAVTFVVTAIGGLAAGRPWVRMGTMGGRMGPMSRTPEGYPAGPWVAGVLLVLAAALAAAVWASGRRPRVAYGATLLLTAAYLALDGPLPAALIAPALTLATLMRRRPQGEWLAWAALLVPVFWVRSITEPLLGLDDPETLFNVFFGVAWVIIPSLLLQLVGARRTAALAAREEELRRVAYEERLRVARDIHDVIGHSLSMISLQSGVALHVLESNPTQVRASLEAIRDASRSSLAELRQTLGVFRQPDEAQPLVPTPDLAGVRGLVESVRAGGRVVGLQLPADAATGVPASVQTVAYRVVQEGLTNAVRHAPGASVAVSVERRGDVLVVGVRDDGPAQQPPAEGTGLRGMRERVEAVGGRLSVAVRPGGGLAVEAALPLAHSPAQGGGTP